jgi:hypothetical protein
MMTTDRASFIASAINWTPAADGLTASEFGTQREGGHVGPHNLYIVRERRTSGGYRYGLVWLRGSLISSLDLARSFLGSAGCWPWDHGCREVVTWFPSRSKAFSAALAA